MAERIEEFEVHVLAGAPNVPAVVSAPLTMRQGIVNGFTVDIPTGHQNRTGLQVWYADTQVIPLTPGDWAMGNGRQIHYDTANFPTGTSWAAVAFNNDLLPHTFHLYVFLDELGTDSPLPPVILLPYVGSSLT